MLWIVPVVIVLLVCSGSNDDSRLSFRVFSEDRIAKNAVVWESTKVTIICKFHRFPKDTCLSWTEPSGETTHPPQYGIKIEKIFIEVTQNDSGRYVCNANDKKQVVLASDSVSLRVEAIPTVRVENVTSVEGHPVTLKCTGTTHTNSYSHDFSWFYEGEELHSDTSIHISSHKTWTKLSIPSVGRNHSGRYECRVTLGKVKTSAFSYLTVLSPSKILEGPRNMTVAAGDTVTFRCTVTGSPAPEVTWERNGLLVNATNTVVAREKYDQSNEEVHTLTVTDVQKGVDSGEYSCHIHNTYGRPSVQSALLSVLELPSPPNMTVVSVYRNGTALVVSLTWTRDGNSSITEYQLECKTMMHDQVYTRHVDSGIFVGSISCAYIHQFNYSFPFELQLDLRILVHNNIGSSSSLLNLTVQVVASKDNRSAFEVLVFPSTYPPAVLVLSTNISTDSYNSSSSFNSSNTKTSTTEMPHSNTVPVRTSKSASNTTPIQLLPEGSSNGTDMEENIPGSKGVDSSIIIPVVVVVTIVAIGSIIGVATGCQLYKKYRDQLVVKSRHINSHTLDEHASDQETGELSRNPTMSPDSPNVAEDELSADTSAIAEGSSDSDARDCCSISVSTYAPTADGIGDVVEDEQSTESNASDEGSVGKQSHDCPNTLDEPIVYSSCRSSLKEQVGPEGGIFESGSLHLDFPPKAVSSHTQIEAELLGDAEPMPIAEDRVVLSLILHLQPDDLSLRVPVGIKFPFTAKLGGWILELMRFCPDTGWKCVLIIDTNIPQVTALDAHCNYDLKTQCLQLSHFCKYRWCGYRRENAPDIKKKIACLLFARMDTSGRSCNFSLYFTDNCDDILQDIKENEESKSKEGFAFKDKVTISIARIGQLNIKFSPNGFRLKDNSGSMSVDLTKLWKQTKAVGILERKTFSADCVGRSDGSSDLELLVSLSTSGNLQRLLATFSPSEMPPPSRASCVSAQSRDSGVHMGGSISPATSASSLGKIDEMHQRIQTMPSTVYETLEGLIDMSSEIESTLHSFKGSCLEVEVGPKGGFYQSGDLSLLIPEGALLEKQKIRAAFHFEAPSTETTFTFSPILLLEPDNLHFNNIPVKIKFPYTARQGWMLHLKRKDSFRGWVTVLTVDTDTHETMSLDSHCKFSVYTGLLELRHFCEYKWCGRKKQTASEKFLGCTLYARMIPHGTRCHFILFLTDHCNDAYEENKTLLPSASHLSHKDRNTIIIWPEGLLTIAIESADFKMKDENLPTVPLKELWQGFGTQKRIEFAAIRLVPDEPTRMPTEDILITLNLTSEIPRSEVREQRQLLAFFELEGFVAGEEIAGGASDMTSSSASEACSVIDSILPAIIFKVGPDWIRFGSKLLGEPVEQIQDYFTSLDSCRMKDSDKARALIHRWKRTLSATSDPKRAIDQLRSAFKEIDKEGQFDVAVEKLG